MQTMRLCTSFLSAQGVHFTTCTNTCHARKIFLRIVHKLKPDLNTLKGNSLLQGEVSINSLYEGRGLVKLIHFP